MGQHTYTPLIMTNLKLNMVGPIIVEQVYIVVQSEDEIFLRNVSHYIIIILILKSLPNNLIIIYII